MQALIFVFKSAMIYPMESNEKKKGRPSAWDGSLTKVGQSGTQFPKEIWELLRQEPTKITLNEMALNKKFEEEIHRLGVEQKVKRLSGEDKN